MTAGRKGAIVQPTHGVFTRAEIVSLVDLISNPPLADAKEAANAAVVSPLHVTVTAPAATYALPARLMVITFADNDEVNVPPIKGEDTLHTLAAAAAMRLDGNVNMIASALTP